MALQAGSFIQVFVANACRLGSLTPSLLPLTSLRRTSSKRSTSSSKGMRATDSHLSMIDTEVPHPTEPTLSARGRAAARLIDVVEEGVEPGSQDSSHGGSLPAGASQMAPGREPGAATAATSSATSSAAASASATAQASSSFAVPQDSPSARPLGGIDVPVRHHRPVDGPHSSATTETGFSPLDSSVGGLPGAHGATTGQLSVASAVSAPPSSSSASARMHVRHEGQGGGRLRHLPSSLLDNPSPTEEAAAAARVNKGFGLSVHVEEGGEYAFDPSLAPFTSRSDSAVQGGGIRPTGQLSSRSSASAPASKLPLSAHHAPKLVRVESPDPTLAEAVRSRWRMCRTTLLPPSC